MSADENASADGFSIQKLAQLESQLEAVRDRVADLEAENDRQAETIETLQARTDLLNLVENSDEMDGMQRSVAMLQHLQKKAEQERKRGRTESAAVDAENALEVLHYPGIDRTTIYSDFRRAERLVDDSEVCYYDGGENARLVLNLEHGDVPARFDGGGS